jgi:hypothetical protein
VGVEKVRAVSIKVESDTYSQKEFGEYSFVIEGMQGSDGETSDGD